jgi:hypothetical protein
MVDWLPLQEMSVRAERTRKPADLAMAELTINRSKLMRGIRLLLWRK